MRPTTHAPDDEAWRATLAKAAARRRLAETEFLATVATMTEEVSQVDMAEVLHTSQANVSRWAAKGREQIARRQAGGLGADPYEIVQRYALGEIGREDMIAALAAWPYEKTPPAPPGPLGGWDDSVTGNPEGSFTRTVGRAFDDGLLSDEDFQAILDALPD